MANTKHWTRGIKFSNTVQPIFVPEDGEREDPEERKIPEESQVPEEREEDREREEAGYDTVSETTSERNNRSYYCNNPECERKFTLRTLERERRAFRTSVLSVIECLDDLIYYLGEVDYRRPEYKPNIPDLRNK